MSTTEIFLIAMAIIFSVPYLVWRLGRTDFWAGLCIGAGFNQPLMEYQLATGQAVTVPDAINGCVWYDSERDPLAYPRLAIRHRSLRPLHLRQVFSYLDRGDMRPMLGNKEAMDDLKRILAERAAFYGKADLVVDTGGKPLEQAYGDLHSALQAQLHWPH